MTLRAKAMGVLTYSRVMDVLTFPDFSPDQGKSP